MKIHPTAIIHKSAKLADNVEVGPYTVINGNTSIGKGTKIGAACQIGPLTKIGEDNEIFGGAIIGSVSQDLKSKDPQVFLEVGDGNIIREYVTINRSSKRDLKTIVGNNNLLMAYSHIAHDCIIGNNIIMANCGTLAGYVTIEDKVVLGGMAGIHQFVRVGKFAILGGCSKIVQDIAPFCLADGNPARVRSLNLIGLKRANFSSKKISAIKKAVKITFFSKLTASSAVKRIKEELPPSEEIDYFINFIKGSKRGLSR